VQNDDVIERQEGDGEERRVGLGAVPVNRLLTQRLGDPEDLLVFTVDAESTEDGGRVLGTGARASGDYEALHRI
jgi:hypothetical protein